MKFKINNHWNGDTLFECELPAEVAVKSYGDRLGYTIQQAYKSNINLIDADLSGANLVGENLSGANMAGADLYRANLYRANLSGANLARANLSEANLSEANLDEANLADADLDEANSADLVHHPSRGGGVLMTDVDFFTPGARLALELECLLMDTPNDAVQSRWWDSAHEALEQWRQAVRAMEASIDAVQPEAWSGVEAEPPSASAGVGGKMAEVVRFLMGEAPLEGRWFDEPDPHVGGAYWWRKHLTEALAQQPAATSETVNVIGMPEFDGLLDHIYEHGTAAEGVIEKANAFARAVIARYAPQQPAAVDAAREAAKESKR